MNGRDRLFELLADRATEGLAASDAAELEHLLVDSPGVDDLELDLTAASIELALRPVPEVLLPAELRARIEADAGHVLGSLGGPSIGRRRAPPPRRRWLTPAGWLAAAALAGVLILRSGSELAPNPTSLRAELVASDALVLDWAATGDAAGPSASGDVVWSQSRQTGVMRFRGLAVNDPAVFQYQLWIFDAGRDERHPIDGGVFDVETEGGDVLVAVDPRLRVDDPTLFAVTVEQPGGVVVSSRERIAVLAKVGP